MCNVGVAIRCMDKLMCNVGVAIRAIQDVALGCGVKYSYSKERSHRMWGDIDTVGNGVMGCG